MQMSYRSIVLLALVAALASWGGVAARAQAQENGARASDVEARRLFQHGREAYERELFTEAEDAFLAAYEAMSEQDERRSLILLNVAQAIERQGGRDADALEAWKRFEREARGVADDAALLRASQRIRELEARLNRRRQEEPEPISLQLDEEALTGEPKRSPHWAGIGVTGAGGAMVLAGGIVGIVGLARRSAVLDRCDGTACPEDARADADQLKRLGRAADALLWPGLALTAVGTILLIKLDARDDGRISASCGLGGCELVGRF
jgi:tetratricopeptide (TPR) repeat protein